MRKTLEFLLNGERVSLDASDPAADPTRTVLTWLREARGLTGTKEGCAEGDCGACTAVLARLDGEGRVDYRPVNTCILCLGTLDGKELITVEGLKPSASALHPVQQAMVDCHGSQCGFCTPGFVMALYADYKKVRGQSPNSASSGSDPELCDAIAGNLCRCTGYRPILEAGMRARTLADAEAERREDEARAARLAGLPQDAVLIEHGTRTFFAPTSAARLAAFLEKRPGATILGGGTDLGLLITKAHRDLESVAYTGKLRDMQKVSRRGGVLEIGGAATYADAMEALAALHPDLGELLRRLGAVQVRAAGTLAGNIANGSPIGDSMPPLLALGAELLLQKGAAQRTVALEAFYTGYRKNVLQPGEFIRAIRVPRLAKGARFAVYKLTKRLDQDISAVCAAFHVPPEGPPRFGFGGMAATPARAPQAEAAWSSGVGAACEALARDFQPLGDHRGSAWYRLTAAQNLLRRFELETGSPKKSRPATRILEVSAT